MVPGLGGAQDRAGDLARNLSGGMKRRLNMAAGIIHRPRVVLMDEPTVGVDPQSRNRIFEMIEALRDEGTAIIYTTHYMEEAERLCDRIAIIDHGRIIAQGTHEELVHSAFASRSQVLARFDGARRRSTHGSSGTRGAWSDGAARIHHRTSHSDCRPARRRRPLRPRADRRIAAPAQSGVRFPAPYRKGVTRLIIPIVRTAMVSLRRDRAALAMSFILPIAFFSIFAVIFGGQHDSTPKISVILVDEDHSPASHDLVQRLAARRLAARHHQASAQGQSSRAAARIHGSNRRGRGQGGRRSGGAHHSQAASGRIPSPSDRRQKPPRRFNCSTTPAT